MNIIISFINDNLSLIVGILGGIFIPIILHIKNKNDNKKETARKEKREEYQNKAELRIDNELSVDNKIPVASFFVSNFKAEVDYEKDDVIFDYPYNIFDKSKYKHKEFYVKNVGNTSIESIYFCVYNQQKNMLVDIDNIKSVVLNKSINYSYCYDTKILKNECLKIDITYFEDSLLFSSYFDELILIYRDSYNNLYFQYFNLNGEGFIDKPKQINWKDSKYYINTETALMCFKNPSLW